MRAPRSFADCATFGLRAAGALIDGVILLALLLPLAGIGALAINRLNPAGARTLMPWAAGVLAVLVSWFYFTVSEASPRQATPGKRAMQIVVADRTGRRISLARANVRYWCRFVSAALLLGGFLIAALNERRLALHDLMAGTIVLKATGPYPIPPSTRLLADELFEDLLTPWP